MALDQRLVLGTALDGGGEIALDLDRLIGTNLCIEGNPGSGKSGAIRKVLELANGRAQRIVLDVEDEFYTLREKFPFIIAGGDDADCPVSIEKAPDLVRTLMETGVSAVVQLNAFKLNDRRRFIALFLEALMALPKSLWHPLIVVLDEAHRYAPNNSRVDSSDAVGVLMDQGRKRGYVGVLATQRHANIARDATASVNNWLMGLVGQGTDRRTVANELGFAPSSAEAKGLAKLETRQFWSFGPALTREPILMRVGDVATTLLKRGQARVPTPPPPDELRGILSALTPPPPPPASVPPDEPTAKGIKGDGEIRRQNRACEAGDLEAAKAKARAEGAAEGRAAGWNDGHAAARAAAAIIVKRLGDDIRARLADLGELVGEALLDIRNIELAQGADGQAYDPRALGLADLAAQDGQGARNDSRDSAALAGDAKVKVRAIGVDVGKDKFTWSPRRTKVEDAIARVLDVSPRVLLCREDLALLCGYQDGGPAFRKAVKALLGRCEIVENAGGLLRLSGHNTAASAFRTDHTELARQWIERAPDKVAVALLTYLFNPKHVGHAIEVVPDKLGYDLGGPAFRKAAKWARDFKLAWVEDGVWKINPWFAPGARARAA